MPDGLFVLSQTAGSHSRTTIREVTTFSMTQRLQQNGACRMSMLGHLAGAHSDDWDWQLRGACRSYDPEMFFHPDNERGAARQAREAAAKAVCAQCPVLATCREHARASRERYGVWGGLSESELEEQLRVSVAD